MRKHVLLWLLCGLTLFSGCASQGPGETETGGYGVYFMERDLRTAGGEGALRTEPAGLLETGNTRQLAEALLLDLLDGPRDGTLKNTVPAGTALLSLELEGTRALVDMSAPYGTLSGVALTLADQAVALTLTQLPDILSVKITVRGEELDYREKQVFTARDVLLAPEGDVVSTVGVQLYFLNEGGILTAEERTLDLYEGDTQVSAVARAMENGPEDSGLSAVFPEGFRAKSVWLEEDVCYVNLSTGLLETLPEGADLETALRALARSLGSLETVEEIRFLVDGEFARLYGGVHVEQPYMA